MHDMDIDTIEIPFDVEIVLRHREEPRRIRMLCSVPTDISTVDQLMGFVTQHVLIDIDTVGQNRMVMKDDLGNAHITLISEVQGIMIGAPEELPLGLGIEYE